MVRRRAKVTASPSHEGKRQTSFLRLSRIRVTSGLHLLGPGTAYKLTAQHTLNVESPPLSGLNETASLTLRGDVSAPEDSNFWCGILCGIEFLMWNPMWRHQERVNRFLYIKICSRSQPNWLWIIKISGDISWCGRPNDLVLYYFQKIWVLVIKFPLKVNMDDLFSLNRLW